MTIREILADKGDRIYAVSPETQVGDAVTLMINQDISSVVVLRDGKLAGLVTLREVLRGLHRLGPKLTSVPVAQIMTAQPVTGHPDDSVYQLRTVMTENHVTHLPILESDALVGIISFHDVARSAMKEVAFENTLLKSYIKNWPEQAT
jgi:CBS domain-containing protein